MPSSPILNRLNETLTVQQQEHAERACLISSRHARPVVVSLLRRPIDKLGGQEIRWGRLTRYLLDNYDGELKVLINRSLYNCLKQAGIDLDDRQVAICEDAQSRLGQLSRIQYFLWKAVRRGSIIHIPAVGFSTVYTGVLCQRLKGCKLIFSFTATTLRGQLEKAENKKGFRIANWLSKRVDVFDILNPSLDWQGIVPEAKIRIAPCSFSYPDQFGPKFPKLQKIVFAGHLTTVKGADLLIEIMRNWPQNDATQFVICGDSLGNEFGRYAEQEIDRLCAMRNGWVRLRPFDIAPELADAKVFLSLQTWSNYPSQSLLEAMLSGCCIVATNEGETHLMVQSPFGVLVPIKERIEEYIRAIRQFLDMPTQEFTDCSALARAFVLQNHTIERHAAHVIGLWNEFVRTQ